MADKYIVRKLSNDEYVKWEKLVEVSPQGTIFHSVDWIKFFGFPFNIYGCFKGEKLIGGIILPIKKPAIKPIIVAKNTFNEVYSFWLTICIPYKLMHSAVEFPMSQSFHMTSLHVYNINAHLHIFGKSDPDRRGCFKGIRRVD